MGSRLRQPNKIARSTAADAKGTLTGDETSKPLLTGPSGMKRKATVLDTKPEGAAATGAATGATAAASATSSSAASSIKAPRTASTVARRGGAAGRPAAGRGASATAARATSTRRPATTGTTGVTTGIKPPTLAQSSTGSNGRSGVPARKVRPVQSAKERVASIKTKEASLKQRVQGSAERDEKLDTQMNEQAQRIQELQAARDALMVDIEARTTREQDINTQLETTRGDLAQLALKHTSELAEKSAEYEQQMLQMVNAQEQLQSVYDEQERKLHSVEEQLEQERSTNTELRSTISSQSAAFLTLEGDHTALKAKHQSTEATLANREETIVQLRQQLEANNSRIAELEVQLGEEETNRRKLHNAIQELKGNIRVFCRVRPPHASELPAGKTRGEYMTHMKLPDGKDGKEIELTQLQESANGAKTVTKAYPFTFDNVFPLDASQQSVFDEISQLVQSALDGYHVCIFAYGQTGSGKTHTMEGPNNPTDTTMGMIPRAVRQIFAAANELQCKGWKYEMEGQYVEIYNETIRDLLGDGEPNKKHDIRHETDGRTTITNITTVPIGSPDQVSVQLKKASATRSVGATQCNERSSRSHSVFTLRLTGVNAATQEKSRGVLNLIDLAGSERLSQSGATGDRLRETQAINKSLSSLGDVIAALANKETHIPYRNSKLTYLLQNSLGGNSKTLMFVNVSPLPESFQETLCSLRFATKVNACQIGTARRVAK